MSDSASPMVELLDDGLSLGDVLDGAPEAVPLIAGSLQEHIGAIVTAAAAQAQPGDSSGLFTFSVTDPQAVIASILAELAGRALGPHPLWIVFRRPSTGSGVLFALSSPNPTGGEADLVVVSHPAMLNRSILRAAARWAFFATGLRRLVCRIPADRAELADYARRAGFRHEGTARDFFGEGADASVWAMTARSCPWLPQSRPAIPTADTSPPPSLKVH